MSVQIAPTNTKPQPNSRYGWIDAAKGISIMLVVLVHSADWLGFAGIHSEVLKVFNKSFATIQIPLFFCMSGLFAVKWLSKPWRELASRKLTVLLWIFVVWQPVVFFYKVLAANTLPDQQDSSLFAHIARMVLSPFRPNGELWFLWALALFFVVAKLLSRLPVWLHISLAAVASASWWGIAEPLLGQHILRLLGSGWEGVFTYYFFFVLGVFGRRIILGTAERAPKLLLVGVVTVWALTEWYAVSNDLVTVVPVAYFFMKCLGLLCGMSLALLIGRLPGLTWLGSRTLQVYVAHTFFIVLIAVGIVALGLQIPNPAVSLVVLVGVGAVGIAASLIAHALLNRTKYGRYLYTPPQRVEQFVNSFETIGVTAWIRH